MKCDEVSVLESHSEKIKKGKAQEVRGRKFNGAPYLNLKKVNTLPRQRIRQLLRASIPLENI